MEQICDQISQITDVNSAAAVNVGCLYAQRLRSALEEISHQSGRSKPLWFRQLCLTRRRRRAALEQVCDQIRQIADVYTAAAVNVGCLYAQRLRAALEEISYQVR